MTQHPVLFGIRVNYFNASKNDFPVGSLVFCQGTMTVLESVSNDPVLSVRATSLLRLFSFVDQLTYCHF